MQKICSVKGCNNVVNSFGFCSKHCHRYVRHGDPLFTKTERHGKTNTPEWKTWLSMKRRCLDPSHEHYKYYGGKGITVCEKWRESFIAFYNDMGSRPFPKAQLDRIDNDKGYEPDNCRWVTATVNCQNRNSTRLTPEKVKEIRSIYPSKSTRQLGRFYSVSRHTISHVVNYKSWKNIKEGIK